MTISSSIKKLSTSLYNSIRRFPVTIALGVIVAVMAIFQVHWENISDSTRTLLTNLQMIFAMGIPLSACIGILFERFKNIKPYFRALICLAGAAFLILYYFTLPEEINTISMTRYAAINIALYLCFIFIPYLPKIKNFEMYVIKLFTRFIITVVYSGVIYAGICVIIFTIDKLLFEFNASGLVYSDAFFLVAGTFGICFFLAGVPAAGEELDKNDYPSILKILVLYILIPMLSIYTLILYIYFLKILITLQWPEGVVTNLVLWYSIVGTAVLFFVSPLKDSVKWVKYFISWFSKLILPLIVMMFVSMGIRISAYGITENRYYVLVMGVWLAAIMIYYSLKKSPNSIILPVSLAIIAVLSVVGPWSSFSVSEYSQNKRLEAILTKYDMIENNEITRAKTELSTADKIEITEIISYFENTDRLEDVKYLPENYDYSNFEEIFGFAPIYQANYLATGEEEVYFYRFLGPSSTPIDIKDFDYFFYIKGASYNSNQQTDKELTVTFDITSLELVVNSKGKEIYKKNLYDYVESIYKKQNTTGSDPDSLAAADMTFTDENDNVRVKILIENITGENQPDKKIIQTFDFYLFVKIK
ncbi:MAG: DUF4153 domain-containing protein [Actinomycetota bacterium]|nr:DUF4153 domain-containing protein [Actinomycetota bacterium]